ncbi:hypothetical protein J1N35_001758, partial [Gossypium stocksii]
YKVRGPFSKFFGRMQSETVIFPRFLQVRPVTLPCELDPSASPVTLPFGLVPGSCELDLYPFFAR